MDRHFFRTGTDVDRFLKILGRRVVAAPRHLRCRLSFPGYLKQKGFDKQTGEIQEKWDVELRVSNRLVVPILFS